MNHNIAAINERAAALGLGERFEVKGLPSEDYHAADGLGSTAILRASQSMAHYRHYMTTERNVTKPMLLGVCTHLFIFEPERVNDLIVVQPDYLTPGNNNAWKHWKAEQTRTIVTQAEYQFSLDLANSIKANLGHLFEEGDAELSIWFRCPQTALLLKARLDYRRGDAIVDLKTTRAESAGQFANIVGNDYAIQDAHYRYVADSKDMIFAGVSKDAPYQCFLAKQGKEKRARTQHIYRATLDAIVFAQEYNTYPYPPVEVIETTLKPWE